MIYFGDIKYVENEVCWDPYFSYEWKFTLKSVEGNYFVNWKICIFYACKNANVYFDDIECVENGVCL